MKNKYSKKLYAAYKLTLCLIQLIVGQTGFFSFDKSTILGEGKLKRAVFHLNIELMAQIWKLFFYKTS